MYCMGLSLVLLSVGYGLKVRWLQSAFWWNNKETYHFTTSATTLAHTILPVKGEISSLSTILTENTLHTETPITTMHRCMPLFFLRFMDSLLFVLKSQSECYYNYIYLKHFIKAQA